MKMLVFRVVSDVKSQPYGQGPLVFSIGLAQNFSNVKVLRITWNRLPGPTSVGRLQLSKSR